MPPATRHFKHHGHRLVFDEYGSGDRPVILLPGLLLSRKMHGPLAETLAGEGYRVLCLDPLGHGDSDRPAEMWNYSMAIFGSQAVALMDHLELHRAVIGGTSLGANATLEAAALAQDRLQGMLIEMPVLDNALLGCALAFTPLLVSLTFGAPITRQFARLARLVP
ncbi:MAG: alpha/beta fold hydrolase, partial [Pseudonocardiaceae bacterium]